MVIGGQLNSRGANSPTRRLLSSVARLIKTVACFRCGAAAHIDSKGARLPHSVPLFTAHCPRDRAFTDSVKRLLLPSINTKSSNNESKLLEKKVLEPSESGHRNKIIDK